ncbi:hypothetical protein AbHV_ORF102 [Abalone herpesvirus Victoria/AUS/2009]|uniref:Uncharacterized protein n=2 Tax=Aurivirus haliotidmalaco1 TaxID=3050290 RepID=K4JUM7_ABHV|nr:hypothetical protein AbHV_ORF102 [Abalone herpesvirus Victoria/AUS/2009]ADP36937.1 p134c [Abalone herpesvirus Victoria/AUS/2007]AFU90114.1 hypothetical protein AbHV_ORF102 [Abalone herpesvirus Victoria/AUS/2009]
MRFIFYSVLLVVSTVMNSRTADITTMPETKSLLNWGIVMSRGPNVINGITKYRHTFQNKIPVISFTKVQEMQCDTDELKFLHCEAINTLIENVNEQAEPVVEDMKNKIAIWLRSVPNIDNTEIGRSVTGKRKKRSLRRKRATNLGPDYCEKVKTGDYQAGGGGNVLSGIGNALSSLFGQPTWDDIKIMNKHVCQLADATELNSQQIVALGEDFATFSKVANQRMDAIEGGISEVNDRVTATAELIKEVAVKAFDGLSDVQVKLKRSMAGTDLLFKVQESLYEFQNQIQLMKSYVDEFGDGINILLSGRLPPQMVPVNRLKEIINIISEKTTPSGRVDLVDTDPNFYYMLKNVVFTKSTKLNSVFIMVNFPLYSVGGLMATYRIDNTYISTSEDQSSSTRIVNVPDFIAVTPELDYFTEYSTAELYSCEGSTVRSCHNERALQDMTKPSCAAALYMDNKDKILELCDIRFDETPVPSGAVKLSDDTYIVHSSQAGTGAQWTLNCPLIKNYVEKKIEACNTCILTVQCGCELIAPGEFIIPIQLSSCAGNLGTIIPDIKPEYPISLPVLHAYLNTEFLNKIKGDTVRPQKWGVEIPRLTTLDKEWDNSVEMSRKYSSDLKKVIKAAKENRVYYSQKVDAYVKEAKDFTDLKLSPIKTLSNTFTNLEWLANWDVLGAGTGMGAVLLPCVLSFVLSCYVLCRRSG